METDVPVFGYSDKRLTNQYLKRELSDWLPYHYMMEYHSIWCIIFEFNVSLDARKAVAANSLVSSAQNSYIKNES